MAASTAAVAITLDVHWFDYLLRAITLPKGAVVVVFDRNGAILATNDADVGAAIAAAALQGGRPGRRVAATPIRPRRAWRFGNAALMGNTIFVAFADAESRLFGQTYLHVGIDFLLPIADDPVRLDRDLVRHRPPGDAMDRLSAPHRRRLSQRPLHHPSRPGRRAGRIQAAGRCA